MFVVFFAYFFLKYFFENKIVRQALGGAAGLGDNIKKSLFGVYDIGKPRDEIRIHIIRHEELKETLAALFLKKVPVRVAKSLLKSYIAERRTAYSYDYEIFKFRRCFFRGGLYLFGSLYFIRQFHKTEFAFFFLPVNGLMSFGNFLLKGLKLFNGNTLVTDKLRQAVCIVKFYRV